MFFLTDLKSYFDLPVNVYLIDFKGKILECNEIQAKSLGTAKPKEIIGKNISDFYDENDSQIVLENNKLIQRTESPKIFIENAITENGSSSYLSYKMPLLTSASKRMTGILGTSILLDNDSHLSCKMLSVNNCNSATYKFVASLTCQQIMPLKIDGKNISRREQMCLYYLISGLTAKGIARKLGLSYRTVEYYIGRMKEKFNCSTKTELIIKAISAN